MSRLTVSIGSVDAVPPDTGLAWENVEWPRVAQSSALAVTLVGIIVSPSDLSLHVIILCRHIVS